MNVVLNPIVSFSKREIQIELNFILWFNQLIFSCRLLLFMLVIKMKVKDTNVCENINSLNQYLYLHSAKMKNIKLNRFWRKFNENRFVGEEIPY